MPRPASIPAASAYVDVSLEILAGRRQGEYEDGRGGRRQEAQRLHDDGRVYSHVRWHVFLTPFKRWGHWRGIRTIWPCPSG